MLSVGGPDGAAGWSLPLPTPGGLKLSPALTLSYHSGGGNGTYGAGWDVSLPGIFRMTRFGVPRYTADDRLAGPDGEEILPDNTASRQERGLPFGTDSVAYTVTRWVARSGSRADTLEHWIETAAPASPGIWLQWHADGSLSLFGHSATARLADPQDASRVAGWYLELTVNALGEKVLYRYGGESDDGLSAEEKRQHPHVSNVYLSSIWSGNVVADDKLSAREEDFQDVTTFSYRLRSDCLSSWRYGFNVRTRRLCEHVTVSRRPTPGAPLSPITRMEFSYVSSGRTSELVSVAVRNPEVETYPLPPVEFALSQPGSQQPGWEPVPALNGFCPPGWQMADLYGEGLPGLLYQDEGAWWYRAPQRAKPGTEEVTWGSAQRLPQVPGLSPGSLADVDGDGCPEWLVNIEGLSGCFTLSPDQRWSRFIPLAAIPAELQHPSAQLVDLSGGGLQDIAMIGPRSVRLWPSAAASGWRRAATVDYKGKQPLPADSSEQRLVAFTDFAGSGQVQLAEITGEGVTCWPSLGHGHFAEAITLPGFSVENFVASRVYLGDTDGSGTTDILYVEPGQIRVFVNHSGNYFSEAEPISAPAGVKLDDTCIVQLTDMRGQGTAELLLTLPHMSPRSWLYRFNDVRPWLLSEVCTNAGGRTLLEYRSSAQGWLDEKAALLAAGKPAVSQLPFPVHMLSKITSIDDISGLVTISKMQYQRGIWDGHEREFRGFTRLIQHDSEVNEHCQTPPIEIRSWFLSGIEAFDTETSGTFDASDSAEAQFSLRPLRFTQISAAGNEVEYTPDAETRRWLQRALKGAAVRTEVYGLDGSALAAIPYSISRQRWQVRACATHDSRKPAALITSIESLNFTMERIASDPVVSQSLVLQQDEYGGILHQADVRYPRLPSLTQHDVYPDSLPAGLVSASRDEQQNTLWLTHHRNEICNLRTGSCHLTGVIQSQRSDIVQLTPGQVPEGGFSVETLPGVPADATLGGYTRTAWHTDNGAIAGLPTRQALVAYTETAMLEPEALDMFRSTMGESELNELLLRGGYRQIALDGKALWSGRHNLARYGSARAFFRQIAFRSSEQSGETQIAWHENYQVIHTIKDAAGLTSSYEYDWRTWSVTAITDPNDNVQSVALDAWGRFSYGRFRGTEFSIEENKVIETGYSRGDFTPPANVAGFLKLKNIPVATAQHIVADSWMPLKRNADGSILGTERTGELALRRFIREHGLREINIREGCEPVHIISLQSDRYDDDPLQKVRIRITYSDGAGRQLQMSVLNPAGEAFLRSANGGLVVDEKGRAVTAYANTRWAVTGKTVYDNKGQPAQTWLPFYLNDWRPVYDDSAREGLYADTHIYDALGRVIKVINAAGWEQHTQYFPWFTVAYDENDLAEEVLNRLV